MSAPPFGTYKPKGLVRLVLALSDSPVWRWSGWLRILARRLISSLSQGPFDVIRHNIRLRCHVHPKNISDLGLLLYPSRFWCEEVRLLRQVLANGGVFVDIGANIGAFTLPAAVLKGVQVIAVEPNPLAVTRLRFNLTANHCDNVTVIESVIGRSDGESDFTIFLDDLGKSGIGPRTIKKQENKEIHQLPMRTLLSILEAYDIRSVTALKVDVEGAEDDVLMPFFACVAPRLWPRLMIIEDNRSTPPAILDVLHEHGYRSILRTRGNVVLERP